MEATDRSVEQSECTQHNDVVINLNIDPSSAPDAEVALSPSSAARKAMGVVVSAEEAASAPALVQARSVSVVSSKRASNVSSPADTSEAGDLEEEEIVFPFGRYFGHVDPINGLRQGHGTLFYTSGNVYEGEWFQGAAHGLGEKRYNNGDVYRGAWTNGKRSGRGGYLYARGHYFEGTYEDDEASGYGVLSTVGGDRYAGQWKNGKKHGKGRETLQNGQVFVGNWREDKKQGRGKLYLPGASSYIYGIWNEDHFFREVDEEAGADAEADVVDIFGIHRSDPLAQPVHNVDAAGRPVGEAAAAVTTAEGLTNFADNLMSGLESRLEALGRALDRAGGDAHSPHPSSSTRTGVVDEGDDDRHEDDGIAPAVAEGEEGEASDTFVTKAMDDGNTLHCDDDLHH